MIVNQVTDLTTRIIGLMMAASQEFYMTGSRYFGNFHSGSDHDFFVQDSHSARRWLLENGFNLHMEGSYCDAQTRCVYVHAEANIHVQCVLDAKVKNKAQEFIKTSVVWNRQLRVLEKEKRHIVWNLAFDLAITGKLEPIAPLVETVELSEAEKVQAIKHCDTPHASKIAAIKMLRERTGLGLADAKKKVEDYMRSVGYSV